MTSHARMFALLVFTAFGMAAMLRADDMKKELDLDPKKLQFHHYGKGATSVIFRDDKNKGYLFKMPANSRFTEQIGLYSHPVLAGDFEVSAAFHVIALPTPSAGYGVSCGIAVEADEIKMSLARGCSPQYGQGYLIVEGKKGKAGFEYKGLPHEMSKAKSGRLVMRREKDMLICLVSDSPNEAPREISRTKFTNTTIRKVRLFADPGEKSNALEIRLDQLRIKAEEITNQIPERELRSNWIWWVAGAIVVIGIAGGVWWYRRSNR
jgi:hypothetical protein